MLTATSDSRFFYSGINRIFGDKRLFVPHIKKDCVPIIKTFFEKITLVIPISISNLNIDTAFKLAWVGFLQIGEFTYTKDEAQTQTFVNTK